MPKETLFECYTDRHKFIFSKINIFVKQMTLLGFGGIIMDEISNTPIEE